MDEKSLELVSRYLDDDLDPRERAELEERALTDSALATEIETSRQLRGAVAALAEKMEPPAALDRVVEPLILSPPQPAPRVRPVYRWLGVAAAVVLGVTVAMEVAQRNPTPTLNRPTVTQDPGKADKREVFQLSPLPTAAPDENRPLGATDRLLEEELAVPAAPEPSPMDVIGPLPMTDSPALADEASSESRDNEIGGEEASEARALDSIKVAPETTTHGALRKKEVSTGPPAPKNDAFRAGEQKLARTQSSEADRVAVGKDGGRRQTSVSSVVLNIDGDEVWTGRSSSCAEGLSRVRLEVRGGLVKTLETPDGEVSTTNTPPCRPDGLLGTTLVGVPDGYYVAEIMVRSESP